MYKLINKLDKEKKLYKKITITTNHNTKKREVFSFNKELKVFFNKINKKLNKLYEQTLKEEKIENIPYAYRAKIGIKHNAERHKNNSLIYKLDFKGFYDNIEYKTIEKYIKKIIKIKNKNQEDLIKKIIINPKTKGLFQGSPLSGVLSGLACIEFWKIIKKKINNKDIVFTQYSDDIIISQKNNRNYIKLKKIIEIISKSIKEQNTRLIIKKEKTKIQKKNKRVVTGVTINNENKLTIKKKEKRNIKLIIHIISKEQNKDRMEIKLKEKFNLTKRELFGKIAFLKHIDPIYANKIVKKYPKVFI